MDMIMRCQVFGRRERRSDDTLRQPASEKRQGTKSREVGLGRRVPQAQLWDLSGEPAASMAAGGER